MMILSIKLKANLPLMSSFNVCEARGVESLKIMYKIIHKPQFNLKREWQCACVLIFFQWSCQVFKEIADYVFYIKEN